MKPEKVKKIFISSIIGLLLVGTSLILYFVLRNNVKSAPCEPAGHNTKPASSVPESSSALKPKPNYKLFAHEKSIEKIFEYKNLIEADINKSGELLRTQLKKLFNNLTVSDLTINQFIELLLATKRPCVFAETLEYKSECDWSAEDARALGDIGVAVPVKAYDDGNWFNPKIHNPPLDAYLLYVPGALLVENCNVDYPDTFENGKLIEQKYYELYERRLLPMLRFANDESLAKGTKAVVTLPGMGCGLFAGLVVNINNNFDSVLKKLVNNYSSQLPNISLVYFAQFTSDGSSLESINYGGIKYLRIQGSDRHYRNLLQHPKDYEIDSGDDYSNHTLFAFVAWDHVSLPGNDFFRMSRYSDDGVKAAATNSMTSLLGAEGEYDPDTKMYEPKKKDTGTWESIAIKNNFRLEPTDGRLYILKTDQNNNIFLSNS